MNRRTMLTAVAVGLPLAMLPVSDAAAQPTMKSVAGTYTVVSNPVFGDNPRGQMILTPDGRYNLVITRQKMAPIASNSRTKASDAENKAIVEGSIAHYGKYSVDDGGKALTFHVEVSTFPNWDGKPQKRMLTVKGDTLTYVVATPSTGGAPSEVTWKRVKK